MQNFFRPPCRDANTIARGLKWPSGCSQLNLEYFSAVKSKKPHLEKFFISATCGETDYIYIRITQTESGVRKILLVTLIL